MILKKHLFVATVLFVLFGGLVCVLTPVNHVNAQCVPGPADANGDGDDCDYSLGENMFNCKADCLPPGVPDRSIIDVIDDTISWLLTFAIGISVLALVYGGVYYVFSSGDTQKTENAKKIVKYALLGIFIAGISYAIIVVIDTVFH